jgi:hypothetical protein
VCDADVWCDGLDEAFAAVRDGAAWAVPHGKVHRLTPQATEAVYESGLLAGELEQRPYLGHAGGGIVVLSRELWEQVPIDPRFVGWGREDDAWAKALTTLAGKPWRADHPLWHLWHPPQDRPSRTRGSRPTERLWQQYRTADRQRIETLIAEARKLLEG